MIAGTTLFIGLFENPAVFIVMIAVCGLLNSAFKNPDCIRRRAAVGICFGLSAIACMHVKIPVATGVIVDQRNAVAALCGAFGGPLSVLICAATAAAYRIYLVGAGVVGGVTGIVLASIAGIGPRALRKTSRGPFRWAVGSAAAAVFILPGFLIIGDIQSGLLLMKSMALPCGTAVFLGIFLVGWLLTHEETRHAPTRPSHSPRPGSEISSRTWWMSAIERTRKEELSIYPLLPQSFSTSRRIRSSARTSGDSIDFPSCGKSSSRCSNETDGWKTSRRKSKDETAPRFGYRPTPFQSRTSTAN